MQKENPKDKQISNQNGDKNNNKIKIPFKIYKKEGDKLIGLKLPQSI